MADASEGPPVGAIRIVGEVVTKKETQVLVVGIRALAESESLGFELKLVKLDSI